MVESEMLESFWWVFCWHIAYLWCRHQLTRSMEVVQSTGLTNPERGTTWVHPSISTFYMFWSMLEFRCYFWKLQECKYLSVFPVCSSQCRQHFHSSFLLWKYVAALWFLFPLLCTGAFQSGWSPLSYSSCPCTTKSWLQVRSVWNLTASCNRKGHFILGLLSKDTHLLTSIFC